MEHITQTSHMITEMGIMVTIAAFFLVGTAVFFVYSLKNQKNDRDDAKKMNAILVQNFKEAMTELQHKVSDLITATNRQNEMLGDITEEIRPQQKERIKVIANAFFDLAVFRALAFIRRIRKENHINEHKEETISKINQWVNNLHSDRNTKFDNIKIHGKPMSDYTNPEWIQKVVDVITREVYDPEPNEDRSFTNLKTAYDNIKIDFYKRMNKI